MPFEKPTSAREVDCGHMNLLSDLETILRNAKNKEYHDFSNSRFATPKMALAEHLNEIRENVINGKYDN